MIRRISGWALSAVLLAFAVSASFAEQVVAQDVMPWETDLAKAQKLAAETNRLVLLHFWGTWCPPCMKMEHEVFSKPGLGSAITPFFVPVKVQVENGMNEHLVKQFAVDGFPCDIVMTPQGQVVAKSKGFKPADQYVAQLQQAAQQAVAQARPVAAPAVAAAAPTPPPVTAAPVAAPAPTATTSPAATSPAKPAMTDDRYAYYYQKPGTPAAAVAATPAPSPVAASAPAPAPAAVPPAAPPATSPAVAPATPPVATPIASAPVVAPPAATLPGNSLSGVPSTPAPRPAQAGGINGAVTKPATATTPSLLANSPAATPAAPAPAPVTAPAAAAPPAAANMNPPPSVAPPIAVAPAATAPVAAAAPVQAPAPTAAAAVPAATTPPSAAPTAPAVAQAQAPAAPELPPGCPPLALDGYCPVCLTQKMVWTRGDVKFGAIHRGRTYLFASATDQQTFLADPDRFSPVISGNDPVVALEQGRAVAGKREYGLMCADRMFLFSSKESYDKFSSDPKRYSTQLFQAMQAADGPIRR